MNEKPIHEIRSRIKELEIELDHLYDIISPLVITQSTGEDPIIEIDESGRRYVKIKSTSNRVIKLPPLMTCSKHNDTDTD